jgi:DNA replication and repair protein RecF
MHIQSLSLQNYRNHRNAFFEFDPGLNILCGPNAVGKTNVLEAIYFFISGRSLRHAAINECIFNQADAFFLQVQFVKHGIEQTLKIACSKTEKKILYNNTYLHSFSGLIGILQGTILTPDDAALIKGPPALRRQFLDLLIAQNDPLYIHYSTRFYRAMQQRNCTLRKKDTAGSLCWEQEMANAAAYIWKQRSMAIQSLQDSCTHMHNLLVDYPSAITFTFKSFAVPSMENAKERLLESYEKHRKREMELGFTLTGPHKDDMAIQLDAQEARSFASEGQQRTLASVLRLGEWELLKTSSNEKPIIIVDDIGIGLDQNRKNRLVEYLTQLDQVFVSTTQDLSIRHLNKIIPLI